MTKYEGTDSTNEKIPESERQGKHMNRNTEMTKKA
jgi:hypothetical protein